MPALAFAQSGNPSAALTQDSTRPAQIEDGIARVMSSNTRRQALRDQWEVEFLPDPSRAERPVVGDDRTDPVAGQIRRLMAQGKAAGLAGVLYDNRDRGHSPMELGRFPQLSEIQYDEAFLNQRLDHGLAGKMRFSLPVIGNSSTAFVKGPLDRSIARMATGNQANARRSHGLYLSNHIYVYPEHRDHDPDKGDRLFAMSPHFTLSQGSSHSDQPLLEAFAVALAALQPETRQRAEELGLLAPLMQMVMRRSLAGVLSDGDYLSPRAHPTAFDAKALRPSLMITLANSIAPDVIPPVVHLSVAQDFQAKPGRDYLERNLGETLFTTPTAIGRAWRSFAAQRHMVLDASSTSDPSGRHLQFYWQVLRGDPEHVRITPLDENASKVEIDLTWHDPGAEAAPTQPRPTRIEIAVFAWNGAFYSAPSFLSVSMPIYQNRQYETLQDAWPARMNYRADAGDPYADPTLWPTAPWTDVFQKQETGGLQLQRDHGGGAVLTLNARAGGFETQDGAVTHMAQTSRNGPLVLVAVRDEAAEAQ